MGDVERAIRVGEGQAVADVQLEAGRRRQPVRRRRTAAARTSGRLSMATIDQRRDRRAARARRATGMSAPPVPTSSRVSSGRWAASASIAGAVRLAPPSQRLTRRRSRRLPVKAAGSSSGPSSSSTASVLRSTPAGYPRDRRDAHGPCGCRRVAASAGPSGSGCHNGRHGHRHVVEHRPGRRPVAVELGSRRRPGDPVGVRARARGARHRHAQGALRPVHRRPRRAGLGRRHVRDDRPGHRARRLAHVARATPADADRAVRAARRAQTRSWGTLSGQGTCQVPVPDRAHPPGAEPRVRRPRVDGLGQADQGEPRRRRAARRRALLVLRRLGGQARVRVSRAGSRGRSASRPRSSRGTSRC